MDILSAQTLNNRRSVEGEPAPYRIYVFPCSTYDPNIGLPEPFRIMNHYVELQVDKKEPTAFECEVPQGDYCIYFEVPQNVAFNTNLNLVAKHYEYPLKSLHELGLTFLEVGIPLVITGVVLLSGGAASV